MDRQSAPLLKAAKLWAKTSQRTGRTYYVGRWGGCRVLVLENDRRQGDDEPSHFLLLGKAEDRAPANGAANSSARRQDERDRGRHPAYHRADDRP